MTYISYRSTVYPISTEYTDCGFHCHKKMILVELLNITSQNITDIHKYMPPPCVTARLLVFSLIIFSLISISHSLV